jgi:hypothetical protein
MSNPIPIKNNHSKKNDEEEPMFQTPPTIQSKPILDFIRSTSTHLSTLKENDSEPEKELEDQEIPKQIELSREDIFVNLTLIAKIEAGNKLIRNKSDKFLNIDTSYFPSLTRWINGNNRTNIMAFINLVLHKAFELNDMIVKEKNDSDAQLLFRLTSDLKNSLNGLNNLKQTYSSDKLVQSEIDVMIDNIRSKLDNNSKILNFKIHY